MIGLTNDQLADLLYGSPANASPWRNRAERAAAWDRYGAAVSERFAMPGYRPMAFWELAVIPFDPTDAQPLRLYRAGMLADAELEAVEKHWRSATERAETLSNDLARRGRADIAPRDTRRVLRAAGVPQERWPDFAQEAPLPIERQRDPLAMTTRG